MQVILPLCQQLIMKQGKLTESLIADEPSFKLSLLVLDIYGMLIERLKGKVKPNLRAIVTSLLKHAGENKENPPNQSDQHWIFLALL
jgi:hypothetical protein